VASPFVRKFRSQSGRPYCYDVNTNSFLLLDNVVYDVIDDFGLIHTADIVSRWAPTYGADNVALAIGSIEQQQKAGLLLDSRPSRMIGYEDAEALRAVYDMGPKKVVFEVTAQCNLRCTYCVYSGTYPYERTHASLALSETAMKKTLQHIRTRALATEDDPERFVSFYGGEPLLHAGAIKRIVDEIRRDKEVRWYVKVVTNGTLLRKDVAAHMAEKNVALQVSLDGPRHIHDRFRTFEDGSPTFDVVLANLTTLRDLAPDYYTSQVSFAATVGPGSDLAEINDFFESEALVQGHRTIATYVAPFDTNLFRVSGVYTEQQTKQREDLKLDYVSRVASGTSPTQLEASFFDKMIMRIDSRLNCRLGDYAPPNGTCYPGASRLFVHVDGRYSPCERVGDVFRLGDVDTGFDLQAARDLIDRYVTESRPYCVGCWAQRLCDLCYGSCRKGRSFDMERKNEMCVLALWKFHEGLEMYASIMERNHQALQTKSVGRFRPGPPRRG